jgi:hypothetical protein
MGRNDAVRKLLGLPDTIDTWREQWEGRLKARPAVAEAPRPAQQLCRVSVIRESYYRPQRVAAPAPAVERIRELLGVGKLFMEGEYVED